MTTLHPIQAHLELMVTGFTEVIDGAITILSLGFVRPNLCMTWLVWNATRRARPWCEHGKQGFCDYCTANSRGWY